jgi:hypothetical protein
MSKQERAGLFFGGWSEVTMMRAVMLEASITSLEALVASWVATIVYPVDAVLMSHVLLQCSKTVLAPEHSLASLFFM